MAEYDFKPFNLAQVYGAADQAIADRARNQILQMEMQKAQKDMAENEAIKGAYAIGEDGNLDEKSTLANLYKVSPVKAYEFNQQSIKSKADQQKLSNENAKAQLEQRKGLIAYGRDRLATVNDQASYDAVLGELSALGGKDLVAQMSPVYSPENQQKYILTADEAIKQATPKWERVDLGGKVQLVDMNPYTNPNIKNMNLDKTATPDAIMTDTRARSEGAANRALTMRGQNMVDARSREANSQGAKAPSGYRYKEDGTLEAIPGGPGDKKANPTEGQGKASLYATRAAEADKILNDLGNNYSRLGVAAKNSGIAEYIPGATTAINALSSDNTQSADQAQRNFINAILRQESGAAISSSEFDNARKQYFPQPGDSDAIVRQKAANRQTAIEGLNTMAGPLAKKNIIPKSEPMPAPKPGAIVDGYVFKGGNPADPRSWKKK